MLFRRSRRDGNAKKARTTQSKRHARLCRFEPLEQRRLLSAWDLGSYEKNTDIDKNLSGTSLNDFSGAAYHTSESTEWIYIIDNDASGTIVKYKKDGTFEKTISMSNFEDPEAITHITGDVFAVIEEKDQDPDINDEEFHITIFTISPGTTSIDKDSLNQNAPTDSPPTSGIIKLTHADLDDGDTSGNQGPEGLAYDTNGASDGYFYFAKEKDSQNPLDNDVRIFRVPDKGGTVKAVVIEELTINPPATRHVKDISDIYFVRTAAQPDGRLFVMSDESQKVLTVDMDADVDPPANQGLVGTIVESGGSPIERSLPTDDYEGITFSPDSFEMTVVLDGGTRHMIQYRNFTAFDPDDAPDLDATSDTGIDDDNITTDTTPKFTGTLTRDVSGLTVPVKDAWVFLYKDGVATGDKDETDASGNYSITVGTALDLDSYDFTIRVGENSTTAEWLQSPAANSEALEVNIVASTLFGDLTGDSAVDFQDLTILLANWNQNVSAGQGNLVEPATTPVNINDLTVLLAAWTGPAAAAAPQLAWAAPTVEASSDAVYTTSTEFKVQFDLPVTGVDVTDLVLTGSGGSGASVNSVTDYGVKNVYGFHITGLSIGTVEVDLAPDSYDITYTTGGAWVGLKEWTFIALPGVTFTSGALVIDGSSGDDTITVDAAGGDLTLNGAKVDMGSGNIAASAVTSILIEGYAGDDTIDLSAVTSTDFTGAGLNGNITIYGGSGSDTLMGSAFDDVIDGDQGTYIARWELNEIDASGYTPDWVGGYDGEIIDDPQVTAGGPSGDGYLAFDGGDDLTIDRVVVGDVDAMKIRDRDFSMSA